MYLYDLSNEVSVQEYTNIGFEFHQQFIYMYIFQTCMHYQYICFVQVITKVKETLPTGVIVGVSLVGTALLIMIIAIVIWRMKVVPKTQTHCITSAEYMNKSESVDMILQNVQGDKVDESVDCFVNENYEAIPPADTAFRTFRNSGGSNSGVSNSGRSNSGRTNSDGSTISKLEIEN